MSKSSIRRLKRGWTEEFGEWSRRPLEDREVVYMWADGIYVKAGLERDKAAVLVVIGAMRDGSKEVLVLVSGYRESVESWSGVLRDLRARGIGAPRLLVADGNAAIWGAARQANTVSAWSRTSAGAIESAWSTGYRSTIRLACAAVPEWRSAGQ